MTWVALKDLHFAFLWAVAIGISVGVQLIYSQTANNGQWRHTHAHTQNEYDEPWLDVGFGGRWFYPFLTENSWDSPNAWIRWNFGRPATRTLTFSASKEEVNLSLVRLVFFRCLPITIYGANLGRYVHAEVCVFFFFMITFITNSTVFVIFLIGRLWHLIFWCVFRVALLSLKSFKMLQWRIFVKRDDLI